MFQYGRYLTACFWRKPALYTHSLYQYFWNKTKDYRNQDFNFSNNKQQQKNIIQKYKTAKLKISQHAKINS